jgi:hypothetical protein
MPEDKEYDVVGHIIQWEAGEMSAQDTVEFFSHLVKSGMAWSLQGRYGRQAAALIERGILDEQGNIDQERLDQILAEA